MLLFGKRFQKYLPVELQLMAPHGATPTCTPAVGRLAIQLADDRVVPNCRVATNRTSMVDRTRLAAGRRNSMSVMVSVHVDASQANMEMTPITSHQRADNASI